MLRFSEKWTMDGEWNIIYPMPTESLTLDICRFVHISKSIIIDVGWYPDLDENGRYRIQVHAADDYQLKIEDIETEYLVEAIIIVGKFLEKYS